MTMRASVQALVVIAFALLESILVGCAGTAQPNSHDSVVISKVSLPPAVQGHEVAFLFGMHVHRGTGTDWPKQKVAALRLWDTRTNWRDLEPQPGAWNFTILDGFIAKAQQNDIPIMLTLAMVPQWASSRPQEASVYGLGAKAPPRDLADWTNYVHTVALRYKGKISAFEVLNEPNSPDFFSGTVQDQFNLLRAAHDAIKSVNPDALVVGMAYNGSGYQQLDQLLAMGADKYFDAFSYHFYKFPDVPEAQQQVMANVLSVTSKYNLSKPIWDSEIGFGPSQTFTSEDQQAAYFARTILINWSLGVKRTYWYAWDDHEWPHLWMTEPDNVTPTKAGVAYGVLQQWLVGAHLQGCATQDNNLYTCTLTMPDAHTARILWTVRTPTTFQVPVDWNLTEIKRLDGSSESAGASITATESPVLML